eukprot:Gb_32838 [translate_table: standard]
MFQLNVGAGLHYWLMVYIDQASQQSDGPRFMGLSGYRQLIWPLNHEILMESPFILSLSSGYDEKLEMVAGRASLLDLAWKLSRSKCKLLLASSPMSQKELEAEELSLDSSVFKGKLMKSRKEGLDGKS